MKPRYFAEFKKKDKQLRQCYNTWKKLCASVVIYQKEGWVLIDAFKSAILTKEDFVGE